MDALYHPRYETPNQIHLAAPLLGFNEALAWYTPAGPFLLRVGLIGIHVTPEQKFKPEARYRVFMTLYHD